MQVGETLSPGLANFTVSALLSFTSSAEASVTVIPAGRHFSPCVTVSSRTGTRNQEMSKVFFFSTFLFLVHLIMLTPYSGQLVKKKKKHLFVYFGLKVCGILVT